MKPVSEPLDENLGARLALASYARYSGAMTNLVYIFDYRTDRGTFLPFRVPAFLARAICNGSQFLDYAETEQGY